MYENDETLLATWMGAEAPLLPLLHAFHERDGCLTHDALQAIAKGLRIPIAELFGTATFYHHLARVPNGQSTPRVCTGPVCRLRGADRLLNALRPHGAVPMACAGRCDDPIPVLFGNETRVGRDAASLAAAASPLPPINDWTEECVFRSIREPGRSGLEGYRSGGGYVALERARSMSAEEVRALVTEAGLAGRGGAGFPTGTKWKAVADASGRRKFVVCNADEGEPGCFKDRALLDHDPHAVLEGLAIAGHATGAQLGIVYLRYEYPETLVTLERAVAEARAAGYLDGGFDVIVRRGAGAYICGEETSLLNSLEGRHPFPRNRPPFPVTHGYLDLPTAVNNVETLASVPPIIARGAAWYRALGRGGNAGTKVISLSGDVRRPGNYEVPIGFPLRTLLDEWAGGAPAGRTIQAVTMAGLSGGFLAGADIDDATLDETCLRKKGSFLGAGGVIVYDSSRDMVAAAHAAMDFFAHESCGKCFPCRIGTRRLTERLEGTVGPSDSDEFHAELQDIGDAMKAASACGLGMAAPLVTESLVRYFPEAVSEHARKGRSS